MAKKPNDSQLSNENKDEHCKQHYRMASGAWINGEKLEEQGSATMSHANSDHGKFETKKKA